jgi:hypothetical protein
MGNLLPRRGQPTPLDELDPFHRRPRLTAHYFHSCSNEQDEIIDMEVM